MNVKRNQCRRLLDHLRNPFKGSITRLEAASELGIIELAARVNKLEELGFVFSKEPVEIKNRWGELVKCKRYRIVTDPEMPTATARQTGSLFGGL